MIIPLPFLIEIEGTLSAKGMQILPPLQYTTLRSNLFFQPLTIFYYTM